jgi:hypothetical protein
MLARASKIDEVFGAFVAAGGEALKVLATSAGGDPSGVVDSTEVAEGVRNCKRRWKMLWTHRGYLTVQFLLE